MVTNLFRWNIEQNGTRKILLHFESCIKCGWGREYLGKLSFGLCDMNLEREHTFILRLFWIVSILFSYGPIQYVNIIICAGSDSMIVSFWNFLLVSYSYFSALLRKLCILLSCPEYSWFVVLQVSSHLLHTLLLHSLVCFFYISWILPLLSSIHYTQCILIWYQNLIFGSAFEDGFWSVSILYVTLLE